MPIIRKFPLTYSGRDSVVMPKGAILLHAESVNLKVYLWAAVDVDKDLEVRTFEVIGDEFEIPEDGEYIDSVVSDGLLSWHVFEINPPEPPKPTESLEEYTENVLAGEVQEPMRISKSTYEMMLKKIPQHNPHALDPEQVKPAPDGSVVLMMDASFLTVFDMLAHAFGSTPEKILRDIMGMKADA